MAEDKQRTRAALQEQFLSSDAYALLQRLKAFEISLEVFRRNARELHTTIDAHIPGDLSALARFTQDHSRRAEEQVEITRCMHNFVASASTLIDHTRVFYRELYESTNAMPGYQEEVDVRFKNHELSQFIKSLRQYAQHYRLPLVTSQLNIDSESQSIGVNVLLQKAMLQSFSGWTAPAKKFIDDQSKDIDLMKASEQYASHIEEFYKWFAEQQRTIHAILSLQ